MGIAGCPEDFWAETIEFSNIASAFAAYLDDGPFAGVLGVPLCQ